MNLRSVKSTPAAWPRSILDTIMWPRSLANPFSAARAWARNLPSQCAVCATWPGRRLCDACIAQFAQPRLRCRTCALPLHGGATQCGKCLQSEPALAHCVAAVDYGYPWAGLIAEFKFRADPGWADSLAELMRTTPWAEPLLESADWLIPIPLTTLRLRERGFNQAHSLAAHLHRGKVASGILTRSHAGADQHKLSRAERLRNLSGAFGVDAGSASVILGRHVLLIDDVMTTGATLTAAARALHAAGAGKVSALVLARVPDES